MGRLSRLSWFAAPLALRPSSKISIGHVMQYQGLRAKVQRAQGCLRMRSRLLGACLVLALGACAQSAPAFNTVRICDDRGCAQRPKNEVNVDAVDSRQDPQAQVRFEQLTQIAQTNPQAAYDLGLRYFRGDGLRQDSYQALVWMRKAAEAGDLRAQKALGSFYLFGIEEIGADPREAEKWLSIAASRGDTESQRLLAQATAAKQSEAADYTWRTQWRDVYYRYWYSGYPYYGNWRQQTWYWR